MSDLPIIFLKKLDGKGGAEDLNDINAIKDSPDPIWLHVDANQENAVDFVKSSFPDIDEFDLAAIFDQDARPRLLSAHKGILVILRGINHNEGEDPEDMIAIRLWISDTRIISLRYRRSKAVMKVADSFATKKGPKSIGDVFASICTTVFDFIETGVDQLDEKIDNLESRVLQEPDKQLREDIADVRRAAILLRRYIAPQKEVISQLRYHDTDWINAKQMRRLQEAQDTLIRAIEDLESIRERAQVVKDELVNALSDKLNRNLYVLSVITAIFLPLGFLTGLFGINIGGMPGVEDASAFFMFCMALTSIVVIQIILFRLFRWF